MALHQARVYSIDPYDPDAKFVCQGLLFTNRITNEFNNYFPYYLPACLCRHCFRGVVCRSIFFIAQFDLISNNTGIGVHSELPPTSVGGNSLGKFVYHAQFEGNIFSVLAAFTISALSFFSFGYLIASIAPTGRVAQVTGMVIAFPMMFLSGAAIPLEVLGDKVSNISKYLPLTYVVRLMKGLWAGNSWGEHWLDLIVILGVLVVGAIISTITFRWE